MSDPAAADAEELLAPQQAAHILGISVRLLQRRAEARKVPVECRTEGGHRRYRPEVIRELARELGVTDV